MRLRFGFALMALAAFACTGAVAQGPAQVQDMIEQLKPAPRTRSLRNLLVQPAPAMPPAPAEAVPPGTASEPAPAAPSAAVADGKPSLSLLVQFDFDSARVRRESLPLLANLSKALKSHELAASRFAIEGHTDSKGSAVYNQRLSQRRADAVRDLLARHGVDPARLVTAGKGSSEPANAADPTAAENRRVRVVNLD